MNGIDVVDQLISSHDRHQRSTNWHHTYIYTSLKMAEAASFKMYTIYCKKNRINPMQHYNYKQTIAKSLLCSTTTATLNLSLSSDYLPPSNRDFVESVHIRKGIVGNRVKCHWKKCNNTTLKYCKACRHGNFFRFFCGPGVWLL